MDMPTRKPVICDNYALRIAADGGWWHQGAPIKRHNLVTLFARQLVREEDGRYWLVTPAERGIIEVDDLPFVATRLDVAGVGPDQRLSVTTNLDETVILGNTHPLIIECDKPAVLIRRNLYARIARPVYYELAALSVAAPDNSSVMGVWSEGVFFALGSTAT